MRRDIMKCEQFIYGLGKGGYIIKATPGLSKLLSDENLQVLAHIGDSVAHETYLVHYLPREHLLSYSHITQGKDDYGRTGVHNHTILLPINELIQPLTEAFSEASNPLKPITLNVKVTA